MYLGFSNNQVWMPLDWAADASQARRLLDSVDVNTPIGLRDRALVGLMVFSFARGGTALGMRVENWETVV